MTQETIVIPRKEFEAIQRELETLRHSSLYKRLLEFEKNIQKKKFSRSDLGF